VPANGQIIAMLDPAVSYSLEVIAYTHFRRSIALPTGTAFSWDVPGVGQPRQFSGTVAVNGVPVGAGVGGGSACPIDENGGEPCVAPGAGPGMVVRIAQTNSSGMFSMTLNSAARYNLRGYAVVGELLVSPITDAPPGSTVAVSRDYDFISEGTTFQGTLSRTGFVTFPSQIAGVGACLDGTVFPTTCTNPRFVYTNSAGNYSLRLPPGTWNIAGFVFIDGAPIIGSAVQQVVPSGISQTVLLNINGDINTIAASSTAVPAPDGSGSITVTTNGSSLANVAVVPSSAVLTDIPADVDLSYGVLSFTSPVDSPGGTAIFDITFPRPLDPGVQWYKVRNGVWSAHPNVVLVDEYTLRISIVDGSPADDDGTANGYVTDPGYAGTPATEVLRAFAAPIKMTGTNVTKAKSSTPVKWELRRNGAPVTDPAHFLGLSSAPGGPGCGSDLGAPAYIDPAGLTYVKGLWKVTWKTPAIKGCYTLTLRVARQQPISATFVVR
jgi:hypothetical protein